MSAVLELHNIECRHRAQIIVDNLSFHVNEGDLACLLGPSGCGKTTALRAIAGFEPVSKGEIIIRGFVSSRPGFTRAPEKRRIGMVFQDYALFPHLSVADNIGFGLNHKTRSAQQAIIDEMLEVVDMAGFGQRYIHELSGGQQQRVALARALAPNPELILLDEPFSNLDIEMRERLNQDVRQILKSKNMTGILVTHDQHEAFAISDHIGVMNNGQLLQWDTAYNLYHSPNSLFIADFIGQGVFLSGTLKTPDSVETEIGIVSGDRAYDFAIGSKVKLLLRPDDIVLDPAGEIQAKISQKAFKGAEILYTVKLHSGTELLSLFPSHHNFNIGEKVNLRLAADHMVAFQE